MSAVVSDTSPIRALSRLSLLGLLESLFGTVLVPPAVAAELRVDVPGVGPIDARRIPYFQIRSPLDGARVAELQDSLGQGEAEAIALALEVQPEVVLIDEADGRRAAMRLGLTPMGVLGVLVRAKRVGLVPAVAPLVERLRTEMDFRASGDVVRDILRLAGE